MRAMNRVWAALILLAGALPSACGEDRIAHSPVPLGDAAMPRDGLDDGRDMSRHDLTTRDLPMPGDASGAAWVVEPSGATADLHGLFALDEDHVWAVGTAGTILRRQQSGAWQAESSGVSDDLRGLWARSANDVWAAGGSPVVHFDGGAWKSLSAAVKGNIRGLCGVSVGAASSLLWAVGDDGSILEGSSGGAFQLLSLAGTPLESCSASASDAIWVVGEQGAILRGGQGGATTWIKETTPTSQTLRAVAPGPGGALFAVGDAGTVLRRDAQGGWSAEPSGVGQRLWALWGETSATGRLWAAGEGATLLRRDAKGTWSRDDTEGLGGTDLLTLHGARGKDGDAVTLWVAGRGGLIARRVVGP